MNPPNDQAVAAADVRDDELLSLIADARPEQQRAIRSTKPLIVVDAGAGTGKTHTLARRFAWLLASDPGCRVDQILTLTFTQLAALEMRERIKATLVDWRMRMGEKLPHLVDAIERIDEAYISTIHSFALRVVKESGLSLDIDPGASMVSEPEEREFWADFAWNLETLNAERICMGLGEAWHERALKLMTDASFANFTRYFGAVALAKLAKEAGELHGSKNASPEELWDFDPAREEEAKKRVAALLAPEWRLVWETWHDVVFPGIAQVLYEGKDNKFIASIRLQYEKWRERECTAEAVRDFYVDLITEALKSLPGKSNLKTAIEDELGVKLTVWRSKERKAYAEISKTLAETSGYGKDEAESRRMLLRTAALGWACWEEARARGGMLSFPDLIRHAGDALKADPAYGKKFRHIMIDEFQDTDGLQENLAASLRGAWGDESEGRTLFVVGDIKQSIYRFRHADPKLFAAYIGRVEGEDAEGEHIPLSCSYRMSAKMMDGINAVFRHIWAEGVIGGTDGPPVRYEPLAAPSDAPWWGVRNSRAEGAPALEAILAICGSRDESAAGEEEVAGRGVSTDEKWRSLARALADRLKQMVENESPIWDKNLPGGTGGEKFRPLRWGDIAILVPARTRYQILEEAFEERGVPALFGGGRSYFNRGEVRDLVNLLRLLERPDDAYALAGWMESPFSALPPGAGISLLSAAAQTETDLRALLAERYPEHLDGLDGLRRRARVAGPSAALLSLLEKPAWLAAYRAEARAKVLANVRKGVDVVREYEATFGRSLSACADYLGRAMRENAPIEESNPAAEAADAMHVMTVHASKGLEFPVVVLAGIEGSASGGGRVRARASRTFGVIAAKLPCLASGGISEKEEIPSVTASWDSLLEQSEESEEKERLLYVGMTRAQERLICCGIAPADWDEPRSPEAPGIGGSWFDWIMAADRAAGGLFSVTEIDVRAEGERERKITAVSGDRTCGPKEPPLLVMPAASPPVRCGRLSASAYSMLAWCPFAYRMRYRQGREMLWEMPDGDGYGGADMGTLAHWVLSRWDFDAASLARILHPEKDRDEIEKYMRALPAFLRPTYASRKIRSILLGWLSAFAAADECAEFREAGALGLLRNELMFRVPFEGAQLVGSIDAFWEDCRGCHIRDWKITQEESAPEEMYRNQIDFYALACHWAKPYADVDVGVVYLRPREPLRAGERTVVRKIDDWEKLTDNLRASMLAAASGPFPPRRDRCERCPFSKRCALNE